MAHLRSLFTTLILAGVLTAASFGGLTAAESAAAPVDVSSITGEVYFDSNLNGVREPWERGMSGVEVFLIDGKGQAVDKVVTDSDGYYQFRDLGSARFLLSVAAPLGFVATNNGSFSVTTSEVGAPLVYSTAINAGIYFPHVLRG